jgi:hypothetical protein
MQIKTTLKSHLTTVRVAMIKKTLPTTGVGEDVGEKETLCTVGRNAS